MEPPRRGESDNESEADLGPLRDKAQLSKKGMFGNAYALEDDAEPPDDSSGFQRDTSSGDDGEPPPEAIELVFEATRHVVGGATLGGPGGGGAHSVRAARRPRAKVAVDPDHLARVAVAGTRPRTAVQPSDSGGSADALASESCKLQLRGASCAQGPPEQGPRGHFCMQSTSRPTMEVSVRLRRSRSGHQFGREASCRDSMLDRWGRPAPPRVGVFLDSQTPP